MPTSFEQFRPKLPPRARVRVRSDGTAGIQDPQTGESAELGADQATLLTLIDGERTLTQLAEAHYAAHGFVPFTALRDLLRTLAMHRLLANDEAELRQHGLVEKTSSWHRAARALFSARVPFAGVLSVVLAIAWLAAGVFLMMQLSIAPLTPWDVPWSLAGAALALSGRELLRAAASTILGGGAPERFFLRVRGVIPFFAPDGSGFVLLQRGARARAHLLALAGSVAALGVGAFSRGAAFGALVVLAIDLCPFAPTSAGKLLATAAGRVDLREHARAYLERRFLRRVTTAHTFEGEGSLIVSALLSLAWLGAITRLLLQWGRVWVVELLAAGADEAPLKKAIAWGGAALLALAMPAFLIALFAALGRAVRSLLPGGASSQVRPETRAAKPVELADVPLFARLSAAEQEALAKSAEHRTYPAGAVVVRQGDPGDAFFAIREGRVVVEAEAPSGLRRELARLGPGDGFGEAALLEPQPRTATVRALTPTTVLVINRAAFEHAREGLRAEEVTALLRATAALRKSRFFERLSAERLSALALQLQPRRVRANEVILREGDTGDAFFLVGDGRVEVVNHAGATVATLGEGAHFGELALLRHVPRTATVRAQTDALLLALDKETFLAAMAADLSLSSELENLAALRAGASR